MATTPDIGDGGRIDRQLARLGPVPAEPTWLRAWELSVLDILFGGHTRGCDCPPCFTCIHDPDP